MSPQSSEALLAQQGHREQWPLPRAEWLMAQSWHHLLFAHWPIAVDALRPHIPAALPIDTFDGQAWLGVVPFEMRDVRLRGLPPCPRCFGPSPNSTCARTFSMKASRGYGSSVWMPIIFWRCTRHAGSIICRISRPK